MNWLRRKLRRWLFPEYVEVQKFMDEMKAAKENTLGTKRLAMEGPLVLVGSLTDCKIEIRPNINPEIILSRFTLDSALKLSGHDMLVKNCNTTVQPMETKPKEAL